MPIPDPGHPVLLALSAHGHFRCVARLQPYLIPWGKAFPPACLTSLLPSPAMLLSSLPSRACVEKVPQHSTSPWPTTPGLHWSRPIRFSACIDTPYLPVLAIYLPARLSSCNNNYIALHIRSISMYGVLLQTSPRATQPFLLDRDLTKLSS